MRIYRNARIAALAASVLAAALVLPGTASAGGGGCHNPEYTSGTGSLVLITASNCFSPHVLFVQPGEEMWFVSKVNVTHNIVGLDWSTYDASSNGELSPGETYAHTFEEPGYYPYACTLHIGMVGVIVVGEPGTSSPTTAMAVDDGAGGDAVSRWALLGSAGALVFGLVGGGAYLRSRSKR